MALVSATVFGVYTYNNNSDPANKKKYMFHTNLEKELLFYFNKISEEDKKEIIEFTKIKARKPL